MRQARSKRLVPLHVLLQETLAQASTGLFADRIALYLLALVDPVALQIAREVHRSVGGPDPAEMLARTRDCGLSNPLVWGAAPVETLARAVESLRASDEGVLRTVAAQIRGQHRAGEVPVLRIAEEWMIVSSLAEYCGAQEAAKPSAGTSLGETDNHEIEGWAVSLVGDA